MIARISNITLLFGLLFSLQHSIRCMQEEQIEETQKIPQYTMSLFFFEPGKEEYGAETMRVPQSASIRRVKALVRKKWGIDPVEQKIIGRKRTIISDSRSNKTSVYIEKVLANNAQAGKYDSLCLEKQSKDIDVAVEVLAKPPATHCAPIMHFARNLTVGTVKQQVEQAFQIPAAQQNVVGFIARGAVKKYLKDYEKLYQYDLLDVYETCKEN